MEAYVYINPSEDKQGVWIGDQKPVEPIQAHRDYRTWQDQLEDNAHNQRMKDWLSSLVRAKNVRKIKYKTHTTWYFLVDDGMWELSDGEPCKYEITKDGALIIE